MNRRDHPDPKGPGMWLKRKYCLTTLKTYRAKTRNMIAEATIPGMLMFRFIESDLKLGAMVLTF